MRAANRALVAAAVLIAVACGGGRETVVRGDQTWTDTGIVVAVGQELQITARGSIDAGPTLACGPRGFADRPEWERYSVIAAAPHIALIGRIGSDGEPFYVGDSYTAGVTRSGRLFLGVNDRDAGNNRGAFTARIDLK